MRKCLLILAVLLAGCGGPDLLSGQLSDGKMRVVVKELPVSAADSGLVSFKVRIAAATGTWSDEVLQDQKQLMFNMDNSFYLVYPTKRSNPVLIQPIANGVNGTYEYLVEFENKKKNPYRPTALLFNDRYITKTQKLIKLK